MARWRVHVLVSVQGQVSIHALIFSVWMVIYQSYMHHLVSLNHCAHVHLFVRVIDEKFNCLPFAMADYHSYPHHQVHLCPMRIDPQHWHSAVNPQADTYRNTEI